MEVYVVVQPDGPCNISNSPGDVVECMCGNISGTGRSIAIDWLTGSQVTY